MVRVVVLVVAARAAEVKVGSVAAGRAMVAVATAMVVAVRGVAVGRVASGG